MVRILIVLLALISGAAAAQTPEQTARAQAFFADNDPDGDGLLTEQEFVQGFIGYSRAENPSRTRLAFLIFGRERLETCIGLAFEHADLDANALLSLRELGQAYASDAFDGIRDMC